MTFFLKPWTMNHYCEQWIADWCQDNGWTDWFMERSSYWAFPPQAVMPVPIPTQALRAIKAEKGMSADERVWCLAAVFGTVVGIASGYFMSSPMPLVLAFIFCAIVVARMDDEEMLPCVDREEI
jgi:hypothetical protein